MLVGNDAQTRHYPSQESGRDQKTLAVIVAVLVGYVPARALEEQPGETQAIKSCEERLCTMLLRKEPRGDDLKCELTKTWARKTIKGAETKGTTWGFGDARCTVQLNISRALIVGAMSQPAFKLHVPTHTAHCVVEQDGVPKTGESDPGAEDRV